QVVSEVFKVDETGHHRHLVASKDNGNVENPECIDRPQDDSHGDCRHQQWQSVVAELAPATCAINIGCFVDIAGNGLKPGQENQDHQRGGFPGICQGNGEHSSPSGLCPVDLVLDDPQAEQDLVEVALQTEDVDHGCTGNQRRDAERYQDHATE